MTDAHVLQDKPEEHVPPAPGISPEAVQAFFVLNRELPPPYVGQAGPAFQAAHARLNASVTPADCEFYHTIELPDGTVHAGAWDLRSHEDAYLGGVDLTGKRVLEVGPGSGWISAHIAAQADLIIVELPAGCCPDLMPFPDVDMAGARRHGALSTERLRNSWWYTRRELGFSAQVFHADIYRLPPDLGDVDIAFFGTILLSLSDPFRALEQAAARVRETIIVTEVDYAGMPGYEVLASDTPGAAVFCNTAPPAGLVHWWAFAPQTIVAMLRRLGFDEVHVTSHAPVRMTPKPAMFTVVGHRSRARATPARSGESAATPRFGESTAGPNGARPAASSSSRTAATASQDALRSRARDWCMTRLRCPTCGSAFEPSSFGHGAITCGRCGTVYEQPGAALNLITPQSGLKAGVVASDNVSSNPYTPAALELIETLTQRGGWVLDCGAGSRPQRTPGVINLEIADYPSTDVLAIGEALPFEDDSFDGVLSLAVLEHVRDPFACAKELVRVLRPGGELVADVPFLQPLHGYPDHYYNMTQSGLRNLFAGCGEILECKVPLHGHPIFAVQWLLRVYLAGLPAAACAEFAAMTIGEAAALEPIPYLAKPPARDLAIEAQNIVGCLNTLRLRK